MDSELAGPKQAMKAEETSRVQIVSRRLVYSRAAIELFWWHLAILVPTVGFKYLYVRRMAFTAGLDGIVGSLGSAVHGAINLWLLVTGDVLEV